MKTKRKTLPKNVDALLEAKALGPLKAIFDSCDLNARGGVFKGTLLSFDTCPDALARWLVAQGADIEAPDRYGVTPLASRARSWQGDVSTLLALGAKVNAKAGSAGTALHAAASVQRSKHAKVLLAHGADVHAKHAGLTALEMALRACSNASLDRLPPFVTLLLGAGAAITPRMKQSVTRLGETFEFHREGFNPELLGASDAALTFLYETFGVEPVPRRHLHDGVAHITVKATAWQKQHSELWALLVPSHGAAKTVQGEVIRITGRISDEWRRNGGVNWDKNYAAMAKALVSFVTGGTPLESPQLAEVKAITSALKKRAGAGDDRLTELAVAWVLANPVPVPLAKPTYRR